MGSEAIFRRAVGRRTFLKTTAVTAGAAALTMGVGVCDPALIRRVQQSATALPPHHIVWVWQFSTDSEPERIADALGAQGLGIAMKTHDGLDWMSKYDRSPSAVNGPGQVERLVRIFEDKGVPFHAWSVIKGTDPFAEARMVTEVLSAGARSLILDLEGGSGFWHGSSLDAARFGEELRRLTPYGRVDISIDPRPWRINLVPMPEFVSLCDGIWPQLYWETFNSQGNFDGYRNSGYPVGAGGMTPEFLLDTTDQILAPYGREVIPVGQGAASDPASWARFTRRAWELGMGSVSVWRYGVTPKATLEYLGDNPAGLAPQPVRTSTSTPAADATDTPNPTRTRRPTQTPTKTPKTRTATPTRIATPTPSVTSSATIMPTTVVPTS